MYGVIQLLVWFRLGQMFVMDGADSVYYTRDLCLPFS